MAGDRGRWSDAVLDPMRAIGDDVADAPAAAVLAGGDVERVNQLFRKLVKVDQLVPAELPPELKDYLATTIKPPQWANADRIRRAQDFFHVWGIQITTCLFCASLPSAYAAGKGVQVLAHTARLQNDAKRRIMETGQFLMDILATGGLGRGGRGLRAIQHVRLMHGAIRQLILAKANIDPTSWNPAWGLPINQEDLAGTLLSFAYVPVEPMKRLGIDVSDADAEDYLHFWNVIGSMLGLRDEMRTHNVADATGLVEAIRQRHFEATVEGKEMTAALVLLLQQMTPGDLADPLVPTLMRHLIGDDVAKLIGVPRGIPVLPSFVPRWIGRCIGRTETMVERNERLKQIIEPFGRELLDTAFKQLRGGTRAPFDIPNELAHSWQIPR